MVLQESFFKNHVIFSSVHEMRQITQPLRTIGITTFTFSRKYDNGHHIRLSNRGDWMEYYYRSKLYEHAIVESDSKQFTSGHLFWSWLNRVPFYSNAALFDIDHGITLIERVSHATEFYHFASRCNQPITPSEMMERLPFFYRFISSFHEKASVLIAQSEKDSFILPEYKKEPIPTALSQVPSNNKCFNEFLKKTDVKRFHLGEKFNNHYLTRREMEIVNHLIAGKMATDIARELSLSTRTLEVHIKHIKEKFNCSTLCELGFNLSNLYPPVTPNSSR